MHFLDRLRAKPKHVKNRYAFSTALIVTLCLGTIWQLSLSVPEQEVQQDASLFSRQLQDIKKDITGAFSGASSEQRSSTPEPEQKPEVDIPAEASATSTVKQKPILIRVATTTATTTDMGR